VDYRIRGSMSVIRYYILIFGLIMLIGFANAHTPTGVFNEPPTSIFNWTVTNADVPLIFDLNDSSANNPSSYNWTFTNTTPGNNTEMLLSTLSNASVTLEVGNWLIKENVSNPLGYSVSTQFINVTYSAADRSNLTGIVNANYQLFPPDFIWNVPISNLPIDPNSSDFIRVNSGSNASGYISMDFGLEALDGYTYDVVDNTVPMNNVTFPDSSHQAISDNVPYPYPSPFPRIEGALYPSICTGDCHASFVNRNTNTLYEMFGLSGLYSNGTINAKTAGMFNLSNYSLGIPNPAEADASGTPMLQALIRYQEIQSGSINHALMLDIPWAREYSHVWPAVVGSGNGNNVSLAYPPMGERFRLNASFNIEGYSTTNQIILTAMKKYGMIVADNSPPSSGFSIQGVRDSRWNWADLSALNSIPISNFEAVNESSFEISATSGQAYTTPLVSFTPTGPLSIWYPNGIAFTGISSTSFFPVTAWCWTWGDGTFSNAENSYHVWTPGIYHVTLNASNPYGYSTNSTWVQVMNP